MPGTDSSYSFKQNKGSWNMENWFQNCVAKPIKEKTTKEGVNCQKLFPFKQKINWNQNQKRKKGD
jgi:hypothetical protein